MTQASTAPIFGGHLRASSLSWLLMRALGLVMPQRSAS